LIIFRVWRDDEYIKAMLGFISRLYTEHVLPGQEPPPDLWARLPDYGAFLRRTAAMAEAATVVARVPAEEVVRAAAGDKRAFLG
jgi:radial spoke head protein 9